MKVIKAARTMTLLNSAFDEASVRSYAKAHEKLSKIYDIWGFSEPNRSVLVDVNLLYGFVSHELGRSSDAEKAAFVSANQIEEDLNLNDDEKKYLNLYIEGFSARSYFDSNTLVNYLSYDLKNIRNRIKSKFIVNLEYWRQRLAATQ